MPKHVESFTVKRVTFTSALPVRAVLANLETQICATPGPLDYAALVHDPIAKGDEPRFRKVVESKLGETGFMFFARTSHDPWFALYDEKNKKGEVTRVARTYTIGNPLFAKEMLTHDLRAGLNVPVRIMVYGGVGGMDAKDSSVIYDLPSSLIAGVGGCDPAVDDALRIGAENVDNKLERMVRIVTGNDV